MASEPKKHTCFGLFFKGFVVAALILANLSALGIMLGVKFLGWDYALWTDFSHSFSRPMYLLYGIFALAATCGVGLAAAGAMISALFGDSKKGGGGASRPAKKVRPQSNRKTTI